MRILTLILITLSLSACGKSPEAATAEEIQKKKDASFSCWVDGGRSVDIASPNDCNDNGTYCIIGEDALNIDGKKIEKDSCAYKALNAQGAFRNPYDYYPGSW